MQLKTFLISFLILSLNACAHGPKVEICVSDPFNSDYNCSDWKGRSRTLNFYDSKGYAVYSPDSYQHLLNYCTKRNTPGTQAPQFNYCIANPDKHGFDCLSQKCELNAQNNGAICTATDSYFLDYADSEDFLATSQPDNTTLMDYCNLTMNKTGDTK